jgi:hypothetical protein
MILYSKLKTIPLISKKAAMDCKYLFNISIEESCFDHLNQEASEMNVIDHLQYLNVKEATHTNGLIPEVSVVPLNSVAMAMLKQQ